jgi:hypothetical protein
VAVDQVELTAPNEALEVHMVEVAPAVERHAPHPVALVLMGVWVQFALSGPETLARSPQLTQVRHEIVY